MTVVAPALAVDGLTVVYGHRTAVRDVELTVRAGERIGVVGPNGAGKSTVLKAVVGLVTPQAGTIALYGEPAGVRRHHVAYLPQRQQIDWNYPAQVRDVVAMGRFPHRGAVRWLRAQDREIIAESLERVGMADLAKVQIGELSGGQQQRVFLARAFAQQATILLLDEPYVGVDAVTSDRLDQWLADSADEGMAVVVVDHDLTGVRRRYDRVVLLNEGVVADAPPAQALAASQLQAAYGPGAVVIESAQGSAT